MKLNEIMKEVERGEKKRLLVTFKEKKELKKDKIYVATWREKENVRRH